MSAVLTATELQQLSHDDFETTATCVRKEGKRRIDAIMKALGHSSAPKGRGRPSSNTTTILDVDDSEDSDDTSDDA